MDKDKVMRLLCYQALVDMVVWGVGVGSEIAKIHRDFTQWLDWERDRSVILPVSEGSHPDRALHCKAC